MYPALELYGGDISTLNEAPEFVHYFCIDLNNDKLPFPDEHFDGVIMTHVLEHLDNPMACGTEIARVLRRGGTMYVETPNWTSLFVPSCGFKRSQQGPFNFYDDPTHVKPWSSHSLYNFALQGCQLNPLKAGPVRNLLRLLVDPAIILLGFVTGRRDYVISSVWNIVGWAAFVIAKKE